MDDRHPASSRVVDLRAGVQVSAASILWTSGSSAGAIALGIASGSVVLVAFGATGLLDAAGSASLVVHFRHELRHAAISVRRERLATNVITAGLIVVGGLTVLESARRLAVGDESRSSPGGTALAAASIAALALLARRKRLVAASLESSALRADAWLSTTGCLLAAITVAGTRLTAALGWWWADPAAAIVVGAGALSIGAILRRSPP